MYKETNFLKIEIYKMFLFNFLQRSEKSVFNLLNIYKTFLAKARIYKMHYLSYAEMVIMLHALDIKGHTNIFCT